MKYIAHLGIIIVSFLLLTVLLNPFKLPFLSLVSFGWGINWNMLTHYDLALVVLLEVVILLFIYLFRDMVNLFLLNNIYSDVSINKNHIDFI